MNLCVLSVLVAWCYAAAQEDITSSTDSLSHCHALEDDENSDCHEHESSNSLYVHQEQSSTPTVIEHTSVDNETCFTDNNNLESVDVQEASEHQVPTTSPQVLDRTGVSSQRATELLVSTWNDLRTWIKRGDTSSACQRDIERSIAGFNNNELWALQMFDAWAKPGPSLLEGRSAFTGNYYHCRNTRAPKMDKREGFKGNYCVVSLANLTNTYNSHILYIFALGRIQLGTCLPDSCSDDDITGLFQERVQALNLTTIFQSLSTDCRSDFREYTTFTYIAILIVFIVGTLTVLGTTIDLAYIQFLHKLNSMQILKEQTESHDTSDQISTDQIANQDKSSQSLTNDTARQDMLTQSIFVKVLLSFSAYTNGRRLLSTSQVPGSISVIPGIRFLTMSWIVVGHTCLIFISTKSNNSFQGLHDLLKYRIVDLVNSMHLGVDSFFTISGFLVSYLTIRHVIEKGWKFNWRHFFLHRYWRLTPTFLVAFVLVQGLQRFAVSGTLASTMQPIDKLACEKEWWQFPLYINNLFMESLEGNCFVHAWSLAADFQFYLLSPLMMLPFYYHKVAGFMSCLFFMIAQWIIAGVIFYKINKPISLLRYSPEWFKYCYVPFYSRIAPFVVGILAGYILYVNGGRVVMKRCTVVTGWILATTAAGAMVFGMHDDLGEEYPMSVPVASVLTAVSRSVWGASVCWVIVACTSGYGGVINTFLNWSPFTSLGRLTYIGYLIQISVSTIIFENMEQLPYLSLFSLVVFGTVDVVFTCLLSAMLVICVEFPILNLEKVIREGEINNMLEHIS